MSITRKQETTVHVQIAIPMHDVTAADMLSSVGSEVHETLQFINACQSPV